jgi:hypothetical protein
MMGRRKITFVWLVAALASLGFRPCALAQPAKSRQDLLKTISQQDARSEAVAELGPDEEIVPLGRVSGAGEVWYFVKTKRGIVGWVRGGDLEPGGKVE